LTTTKTLGLGVARKDGQLQSYKLAQECLKKYYQKMFRYLLNVVCLNEFIIYKKKGGSISIGFPADTSRKLVFNGWNGGTCN
jgi:hypothetical protein